MLFKKLLAALLFFIVIQASCQKTYVFFGSYNWNKAETGLYVYSLDNSGTLNRVSTLDGIRNPSFITLAADGRFLYAVTDSKTPGAGSVSSFAFNPHTGKLTFINSQPAKGENPVYVSVHPSGQWLAVANYNSGSTALFPLNKDGSIAASVQYFHYAKGSINPKRQERSHIHSAIFSPDGSNLYLPDLGADQIIGFSMNAKKGKPLFEETFTVATPGSGPRHFTFHPNGKWGYCIEEIAGAVSVYRYSDGALKRLQRIYTHPDGLVSGDYESSDIHISPDGEFLYAANRGGQNNIAIFSISEKGMLKPIGYEPVRGLHPRTFALDPSGKFLIVANVNSSSATVFRRNAETGLLAYTGEVTGLKNVTTVQIMDY